MPSPALLVFLVRHGLTDWNEEGRLIGRTAIGLNSRGRAQAEALAAVLREQPLRAVVASPQLRGRQTAEPIARAHGLEPLAEPGLDEVWLGSWQGKKPEELGGDPDLERYLEDPTHLCAAIEPASRVEERVVSVVEKLRTETDTRGVLLVSHADPIRILLAHYLSMKLSAYRSLSVAPGSLSVLRFAPRGSRLLALNWKADLAQVCFD